ncbi:hypothetical protein [Dentiradicibacter hellwigii]|uniref:Uncharacterized protein n=1 Tax=Dentiradicibacter hellwigii TaxID=3149053 RepID=A0ABV4UCV5_9RHOO
MGWRDDSGWAAAREGTVGVGGTAGKAADETVDASVESVMQVQTLSQQKYGAGKTAVSYALVRLGQAEDGYPCGAINSMRLKIVGLGSFWGNSFKNKQELNGSMRLCRYSY